MGQPTRESLLLLLLLLVTAQCTRAQQSPPSSFNDGDGDGDNLNGYGANFNAATAILIVVIVTGFFFLGFFSVYFRRCSRNRLSAAVVPTAAAGAVTASRRGARRGLDPAVIETFPTLTYSAATSLRIGKEALECAVCLSEFSADEELRMLPRCCHVFHPECIDTWLEGHVTCPVCRDNLSVVPTTDDEGPEEEADGGGGAVTGGGCDEVAVIDVPAGLGRSRTTGHDHPHVITTGGGGDRYTLRLPEQVRREIVEAASGSLRRSASVAVFRGSGGEGSSRRPGGRSLWVGVSDRWTAGILARVATWRRREAEGSVKAGVDGGESSTSVDASGKSTTVNALDQV